VKFIRDYLGHAKPETTVRFIHGSDDDLLREDEILVQNASVKKEIVRWTSALG
jgi:hypothetical protein